MEKTIILASGSPRRIEILRNHGIDAVVMPADVDETIPEGTSPRHACMYNALKKAMYTEDRVTEGIIIAADTIVVCDEKILGKPADDSDAFRMLSMLRGRQHQVMTGMAVIDAGCQYKKVMCEVTRVNFGDYSDDEIRAYIATGEPADKAGAYAIQGGWKSHVTSIEGDYSNVVGLAWDALESELSRRF